MPSGDPAGYLPNVVKARLKKGGIKPYKPRSKRGLKPPIPSSTAGAQNAGPPKQNSAPSGAFRTGFAPAARGKQRPTSGSVKAGRGNRKRYFGRA